MVYRKTYYELEAALRGDRFRTIMGETGKLREAVQRVERDWGGKERPASSPSQQRRTSIADLAGTTSPTPFLASDGRLDVKANPLDAPRASEELPSLPARQLALITTILGSLPGNAPRSLTPALEGYRREIRARATCPYVGLLVEMAAIVSASVGEEGAGREWLAAGTRTAFDLFEANHRRFLDHFPSHKEREQLYARTPFDEDRRPDTAPFAAVTRAADEAHRAGLATGEFVAIVRTLEEHAATTAHLDAAAPLQSTSPRKRAVLVGIGFFAQALLVVGSVSEFATTPFGKALIEALGAAVKALRQYLGL